MILEPPVASWRDESPKEPNGPYAPASDAQRQWSWELWTSYRQEPGNVSLLGPQVCDLVWSWSLCCDLCANSIFMLPVSGRRSPFSWEQ